MLNINGFISTNASPLLKLHYFIHLFPPHFLQNSSIEKSFLFDVSSKIYIATDYSPVDMQSYELCCDMIDVVLDISYIYG